MTYDDYLAAVGRLAQVPGDLARELAAADGRADEARTAGRTTTESALRRSEEAQRLSEDGLRRGKQALAPLGLESSLPSKVRGGELTHPPDEVLRSANADLDASIAQITAAVQAIARHKRESARRREEEQRRREAERQRREAEARRLREEELAAARRRELIIRTVAIGLGVLVLVIIILLLA